MSPQADVHHASSDYCDGTTPPWPPKAVLTMNARARKIVRAKQQVGASVPNVTFLPNENWDEASPLFLQTYCNVSRPRSRSEKLVDGHVDSTSLPECACDPGHYTTEGQRRLGERFAHWVLDQGEDDSQ